SRRHTALAALLGIPHLVVAVNKMDLVDWSEERFLEIRAQFEEFLPRFDIKDVKFIPLSALNGDNVVDPSPRTPWYYGPTLLRHLETVPVAPDPHDAPFRFPVQYVIRPRTPEYPDYRGYAGQVAAGTVTVGDEVVVLPTGLR